MTFWSAMFMPPVNPIDPSITRSFLWERRLTKGMRQGSSECMSGRPHVDHAAGDERDRIQPPPMPSISTRTANSAPIGLGQGIDETAAPNVVLKMYDDRPMLCLRRRYRRQHRWIGLVTIVIDLCHSSTNERPRGNSTDTVRQWIEPAAHVRRQTRVWSVCATVLGTQQPSATLDPIDPEQDIAESSQDWREPHQTNPADSRRHFLLGQQNMDRDRNRKQQTDRQTSISPDMEQVAPDVIHAGKIS